MAFFFTRNSSARQTAVAAPPTGHPASTSPACIHRYEDLHRPAVWGRLNGQARAMELAKLPKPTTFASTTPSATPFDYRTDEAFQAWFTDVVAPVFHPNAVAAIRSWLTEAPSNAHLYVEGSPSRGRLAVVSTLARQALAHVPAPPDYCYVPDPEALDRHKLLALPPGTAHWCEKIISQVLDEMTRELWPLERTKATEEAEIASTRQSSADNSLARLLAAMPEGARSYIHELQSALARVRALPTQIIPASVMAVPSPDVGPGGPRTAPLVIGHDYGQSLDQALLHARGGILMLDASQLGASQQQDGWSILYPTLQAGAIQYFMQYLRQGGPSLPCPVRVVVIGTFSDYRNAHETLSSFLALFRYRAIFEDQIAWNATTLAEAAYAALAQDLAARAGLPALEPGGVAVLIEEGARRAEPRNQYYLTTDLAAVSDLVIETGNLAGAHRMATGALIATGGMAVTQTLMATEHDLQETIRQRRERLGGVQDDVINRIMAGRSIVPTNGDDVGAINGLGVSDEFPEEENFGAPFRLSVTVSPSERETLVDVEREANAAAGDHIMGELTVMGYLVWRYGQQEPRDQQHPRDRQRPICLRARVREEQEFGRAGGPSASAAMLFALLSALAEVPILRSFAVTGVAGQHGEIQAIGGVNHKIEGFYELCRRRREQGEQPKAGCYGMLIPKSNAQDLMLRPEIARSIADPYPWFKIYSISTIDEGLPILTGKPADEIHTQVRETLDRYYEIACRGKA